MVRFKRFIENDINLEHVRNSDQLRTFEITIKNLPDIPEEFDEFAFATYYGEQAISIVIGIFAGKIKRVMLGFADPEDPDNIIALSKEQLEDFLNQKGEKLVQFFEYITQ